MLLNRLTGCNMKSPTKARTFIGECRFLGNMAVLIYELRELCLDFSNLPPSSLHSSKLRSQ